MSNWQHSMSIAVQHYPYTLEQLTMIAVAVQMAKAKVC